MKSTGKHLAWIRTILCVFAALCSAAPEGGRLTAPIQIPLIRDGKAVGTATVPAGSPVLVLQTVDGKSQVTASIGTGWTEAQAVEITGQIPAFVAQQAEEARMESAKISTTFNKPAPQVPDRPTGKENIPSTWPAAERRVLELVNQERARRGITPLTWDEDLARAARFHAAHMVANRYFTHDSKTKSGPIKCFTRIQLFTPKGRGENIALGQRSPEHVMDCWMRSPGHRENILRKEAKTLGVGIWATMWVQDFGD